MKISLTNDELALFFTKDLKGDMLNAITEKYRIINPVLILENLYLDNVNWDTTPNPLGKYYDKTQITIEFPIKDKNDYEATVYDNIILCNRNTLLHDGLLAPTPQKTKFNHIVVEFPFSTYDYGSGQDVVEVDDEFDIDSVKSIPTISPNAKFKLSMTIERIIDDINTLEELVDNDISVEAKLELLNNVTIIFSDNIYKVIHNFIRDINDNIHEQSEKIYTYIKDHNTINIYKTSRTNYKNTLICSFELIL